MAQPTHQTYIVNTQRDRSRKRTPPQVQGMTKKEYVDHHINALLDYAARRRQAQQSI